jgi:type I restriction enzyme S subunit
MLPKGWKLQTVDDLFHVQLGKMLNQAEKEKNPNYKYLGNSNVRWGYFETNNLKTMYFSERELGKFALQKGDIILCEGGEVGRCAIWNQDESDIFYQKALHRLRSKGNIDPEYFQSFMYFINGSKLLDDFTTKTSIAHLTREKLLKLPVKTPPLPEQRKIAEILSTWDKAIATTEKLIAASQQQKKALMQQLLTGKKRFAGFSEEWEEVKLGDIATYSKGYTYKSDEYSESQTEYGFLTLKSILRGGGYSERGIKYLRSPVENKFSVEQGDIVFAVTDLTRNAEVVGAPILIPDLPYGKSFISMDLVKLKVAQSVNKEFFFYLMQSSDNRNFMRARASGSTVLHLDIKGSKQLKLKIPKNLTEQQKIAAVLTSSDQEINAFQSKLAHLKQEKKALMQQLLTGKRRVVLEAETSH